MHATHTKCRLTRHGVTVAPSLASAERTLAQPLPRLPLRVIARSGLKGIAGLVHIAAQALHALSM